jgi:WD40 repeat protein
VLRAGAERNLWNIAEEMIRLSLPAQELPVLCVRYSPDGSLLATTTGMNQKLNQTGELRLWQSDSGNPVAVLGEHASEIKRVVFHASGARMASVGSNKSIIVCNVAQRSVETKFSAEFAPTAIAFLSDENLLAVGDARGGVVIYAIDRGAVVLRYAGHGTLVPAIAVRPDQQVIATASHDGTLKLWPAPAPAMLNK